MSSPSRRFRLRVAPYAGVVNVLFAPASEGAPWLQRNGAEEGVGDDDEASTVIHTAGAVYMWVDSERDDYVPILAHELVHAAVAILDRAGVPISEENDEAIAYLVGHLMQEIRKRLARPAKKSTDRKADHTEKTARKPKSSPNHDTAIIVEPSAPFESAAKG